MRFVVLLTCLSLLAACGADGAPERPASKGLTLSGEARIGIVSN